MKNCISCKNPIPEGRLKIIPTTNYCVNCSSTSTKKAIINQIGEGDHTCTEIFIVDEKDYNKYYDVNFSKYKRKDTIE